MKQQTLTMPSSRLSRQNSVTSIGSDFCWETDEEDTPLPLESAATEMWVNKDLPLLLANNDVVVNRPSFPEEAETEVLDRFKSIDEAVGLMSGNSQSILSLMTGRTRGCGHNNTNNDSPFKSLDLKSFKSMELPTCTPGIFESREWLPNYEENHQDIEYSQQDMFPEPVPVWRAEYEAALRVPQQQELAVPQWNSELEAALRASLLSPPEQEKPNKTPPKKGKREPKDKKYVVPTSMDVISGRGGKSNAWPGNEAYRAAIDDAKPEYRAAEKYQKTLISNSIVQKMTEEGRRFLKLDNEAGPHKGKYYLMTKNQARKKAGQALREENTPEARRKKREFYANKKRQEEEATD